MNHGIIYNDQVLLQRLATGDESAFRELHLRYWKRLYTAAFKRLQDHEAAKDILQDIFIQIWVRKADLKINNLSAYLFNAVRNRVFNYFEKDDRYTPIEELLLELTAHSSADARVLREDLRKAYEQILQTLSPAQQTIMRLRFEEDLTTDEISRRMNLARKTVQNQLRLALLQIRSRLITLIILWVLAGKQ